MKNKMKLNLGCGSDIRRGWVNLDVVKGEGVDIVHDLNKLPLPFEDRKFDFILCQDVLEHINFIPLMNELYRILKPKGILKIRCPHFTSKLNFENPTHIHQFSSKSFDYFTRNELFDYERDLKLFSTVKMRWITFNKGSLFLRLFNNPLERWINKSEKRQNLYESSFLRIFPAMNIEIVLIK